MTVAAELVKFLGQAVIVVVGWWVVHQLSSARDRDKSRRELVAKSADALADALGPLLIEAREYHLTARDVARELQLKMALQDLSMRASGLSEVCSDESFLAPCRGDIGGLRRAITGVHFEDEHLEPSGATDSQLQVVAEAVLRARRSLLRLKHRQFTLTK